MKRGGPLKRAKGLVRKTALKATEGLETRTPLERKTRLSKRPFSSDLVSPGYDYGEFFRSVCIVPCEKFRGYKMARCIVCEGVAEDAHHVIPKQRLKAIAGRLSMTPDETSDLLMDRRNGVPLCRRCHDLHESAHKRIPRSKLPPKAIAFAKFLDRKLRTEECQMHLEQAYG